MQRLAQDGEIDRPFFNRRIFDVAQPVFEICEAVLAVSFLSLGLRPGLVVALAIPLVLAMTFVALEYLGISLQRISLGALIIALGLLVDDAMIAVEMMVSRLEQGDPLDKSATHVYTSTAFPMLTGTLVTVASFLPIAMNSSNAGEYTFSLFVVIAISLLLSWLVAVVFTPLLGVTLLPSTLKKHDEKPSRISAIFRRLLDLVMRRAWLTVAISVGLFVVSLYGMKFVQQQFFPPSARSELVVDFTLPHNASIAATKAAMDRFERHLVGNSEVNSWSSYVGQGAIRFVLTFDVQMPNPSFGQIIIVAKNVEARDRLRAQLKEIAHRDFVGIDIQVELLPMGPPAGRAVQYRVSGPDVQKVKELAQQLAAKIGADPLLEDIGFNWMEPSRVVKLEVLQDKARQLGVTSEAIAQTLNGIVSGTAVTQVRDDIYLVNVIARARDAERGSIETLQNLQLMAGDGKSIPLAAVANFHYELEQPIVWRRSRLPTVTVRANIVGPTQPATIVQQLSERVDEFQRTLPAGYRLELGGPVEESAKSQGPIAAVVPLMLFVMATILMIQLQSFQRLFMVIAVAPLGLIGVVAAMLPSNSPMGFVAILGVLALIGILIRNSVILIVQIEEHRRDGMGTWEAVLDATMHRTRPIMLTAAAASLALIPISREGFWAPMAFAMMGGIVVGTLLTLLFLPALYVAWFRVVPPTAAKAKPALQSEPAPVVPLEPALVSAAH